MASKSAEYGNKIDDLTLQNETLSAKLNDLEVETNDLRELQRELTNEKNVVVENITAELRVKERLIQTYKEEMEHLKTELENLMNDESELRSALAEKDAALIAVNEDNKKISEEARDEVAHREMKIISLQDELDKANELLKFGGNGKFAFKFDSQTFYLFILLFL